MAHPDGTYDVNITTASGGGAATQTDGVLTTAAVGARGAASQAEGVMITPAAGQTEGVSWVYLQPCAPGGALQGKMYIDMAAESCDVVQNGTHSGWACGYLTPNATMRGLRASHYLLAFL